MDRQIYLTVCELTQEKGLHITESSCPQVYIKYGTWGARTLELKLIKDICDHNDLDSRHVIYNLTEDVNTNKIGTIHRTADDYSCNFKAYSITLDPPTERQRLDLKRFVYAKYLEELTFLENLGGNIVAEDLVPYTGESSKELLALQQKIKKEPEHG